MPLYILIQNTPRNPHSRITALRPIPQYTFIHAMHTRRSSTKNTLYNTPIYAIRVYWAAITYG
jgi:hypothetical protein